MISIISGTILGFSLGIATTTVIQQKMYKKRIKDISLLHRTRMQRLSEAYKNEVDKILLQIEEK